MQLQSPSWISTEKLTKHIPVYTPKGSRMTKFAHSPQTSSGAPNLLEKWMLLYICPLCAATTPAAPGRESFPPTCAGHSCSEDQQQLTVIQCGQGYKLVYLSGMARNYTKHNLWLGETWSKGVLSLPGSWKQANSAQLDLVLLSGLVQLDDQHILYDAM